MICAELNLILGELKELMAVQIHIPGLHFSSCSLVKYLDSVFFAWLNRHISYLERIKHQHISFSGPFCPLGSLMSSLPQELPQRHHNSPQPLQMQPISHHQSQLWALLPSPRLDKHWFNPLLGSHRC